jgi:general secretion pathway protein C
VVAAQWLNNSSALSARVGTALVGAANTLSRPENARRLRQVLLYLLAVWAVFALTRLLWAVIVPMTEPAVTVAPAVINPVIGGGAARGATSADIDSIVGWHLFGERGETAAVIAVPQEEIVSSRAGIEDGAKETRLQLKLRGIVSSTEDGLGFAIIENNSLQDVYAVEDKLPVPGEVVLAKVMPRQVVLDNGGTYELLVLYEESSLNASAAATVDDSRSEPPEDIDRREDAETTSLAQSYRERLYQNPQSLADVVSISAVREGSTMVGYRVSPGRDAEQFRQLGFEAGDVVTSINGVSLDNPTNTMVLYNSLRTAGEVVFEIKRGDQPLSLSVNLDGGAEQ